MRRSIPILVVEDDAAIRELIVSTLAADGYGATGVGDAPSALAHIRRRRPDLIITDYHLPGEDGLELLRQLQEQGFGSIPTLVISADFRPPDVPLSSFIPKPFDLDAILRAVRRALGRSVDDQPQQSAGLSSWLMAPAFSPI